MLAFRSLIACAMVVAGAIIVVRMFAIGLSAAIVPGIVLGAAMIALGLYRLKQLRGVTEPR